MDEDLEKLKRKKLEELQREAILQNSLEEQEAQKQEFEEQKKRILRVILTPEARERLGRIKMARPTIAEAIENQLILLAQSGELKNKINDEQLRLLLYRITPKKRDITIRRK